ncbi:MAG TPA: hypothetical protein PKY77_10305 [Phycisphaerae bacterium]|nr:hypothetical protein [Phycisphaerae bacterium]HRY69970.1 hypothetical protein [Phycisphaerae bacterium]HSA27179.1 hypothetical protein [Phycisphaerae bacterium]
MNRQIDERDEWLLSRLLDGDLTEPEGIELAARLEREPELRASRDALARLNQALVARRKDVPNVDWERFRSRVMDSIETQSSAARVIRFPRWLRVTAPLTAAAVLALIILASYPPGSVTHHNRKPGEILTLETPRHGQGGVLVVQYDRPGPTITPPTAQASVVQVNYVQSAELQEATRRIDKARENEPSWRVYTAHGSASSPILADMLDTPPL